MRTAYNQLKLSIFLTSFFVFPFVSCEHKELCYDHPHLANVQVIFDWKNAHGPIPTNMRLYLFPSNRGESFLYEFTNPKGGNISVPTGHYKALCVNYDTETILYRNINQFSNFEAYATDGTLGVRATSVPRAVGTEKERIAKSPDRLWCAHINDICIENLKTVLTICPKEITSCYRVKVKNVSHLKYIAQDGISGALSGVSGGLLVSIEKPSTEFVTIPFKMIQKDSTTLTADFLCFGHCPSTQKSHKLVIYVIFADGRKCYYTYDVTSQIHNAPDPRNVFIVLDSLPLPKPIVNGSGFQTSVDKWQNININISM